MKITTNKFNVSDIVSVNDTICQVVDVIAMRDDPDEWFYDLVELESGIKRDGIIERIIEDVYRDENGNYAPISSKEGKKTYCVNYSFYLSDCVDIEANSEEEAENICAKMIEDGEIGNFDDMEVGERKIWVN